MVDAGESQAATVNVFRVASLAAAPERRSFVVTPCYMSSIVSLYLLSVMLFSNLTQ